MAHYGGVYMKKKKGGKKSAQANGPGSWSFGPALSLAEDKKKK